MEPRPYREALSSKGGQKMHFSTNILDLTVYGILLISVAAGFYQGLVATTANTAGFFI
jgi:hypothetical protein